MKNVVIIGAGGHAKVVADIVQSSGDRVIGFLDSKRSSDRLLDFPILGSDTDYKNYLDDCCFVIAIGNAAVREKLSKAMHGAKWYTALHKTSVISSIGTLIGEGSVVMANSVINPCASIGKHCIINTMALVEHDNQIADYVHISLGARLAGTVSVGARTWIGAGATINNNISICHDCMIGSGAVVIRDITEPGTYVGVPARRL